MISVRTNVAGAQAALSRIKTAIEGEGGRNVVRRVAFWTLGELVRSTPKKWTGFTRQSWQANAITQGFQVTNTNKVMLFLERGTRAHGAIGGGLLFIPLTRNAAMGGSSLVYGRDYVLARQVRGIRALNIVRDQRPVTSARLLGDMTQFVQEIVRL